MDKEIIKSLRNRSFVKGKQKTFIFELTDKQLWQVFVKIKNGETNMAIARYLQEELGVMPESSTRSVSQAISKFKKRVGDISLFLTPQKIGEMGGLEALKVAQRTLMESIQHKGPGNVNLAKESKFLLEINTEIEKQSEKIQKQNDPRNFAKIAYEKIKNLDKENTKKWVEAVLRSAERKLDAVYWVHIFYDVPDEMLFNRTRKIVSNAFEKLMYRMKYEKEKFNIIKLDED
jgi:hypothetical protein